MLELTKETFEEEVLKAEGKVLVDFYGDGCVPCQALMPHVHELAEQYGDTIKVLGLPVIAIYENGAQIASCVKEEATPEAVKAMVEANI